MSKRKFDEAAADATAQVVAAAKKLKGEKKEKKEKTKKKTKNTDAQSEKNGNDLQELSDAKLSVPKTDSADADKDKKEEKALKKARKIAEKNDTSTVEEKAKKAARKAEKKAAKKAKDAVSTAHDLNGGSKSILPTGTIDNHASAKRLRKLAVSDVEAYFASKQITIDDGHTKAKPMTPITEFSELPFTNENERKPFAGYTEPTPIQAAAWPYLLAGRDVIGVAETGSGKTMAFGVPCIQHIKNLPADQKRGVKAVIVSPTRELALQIQEQIEKLAEPVGLRTVCLYGGASKDEQKKMLKRASVVVATPGRLNDLLDEGAVELSSAQFVVLDEADRMLDKGFEEDVRKIISSTSSERQTLMFTATWPQSVRDLAATFMKTPVKIMIGDNATGELRANVRIKQIVEVIKPEDKNYRLLQLLREHQSGVKKKDRILIFCLYKKEAQRVHQYLQDKNFSAAGIHGDMSQQQRIKSLDEFKKGTSTLLVATDVAARGLDIPAVKVVINVTFPLTAEDYVHRIGRTGRAGQDGIAVTLFTDHDKGNAGALVNVLRAANQPVPEDLLKYGATVKKKEHSAYGAFYKDIDTTKKATKITFD